MIIQHNAVALFNQRQLGIQENERAGSVEKLASGYRVNRAADDAAGLKISEKMRRQIRGLDRASANIEDGISLIQVADGALEESHGILQRMNELAVQAANDTNTRIDRDAIQLEMDALGEELTRIAETTSYNNHVYPLAANWSAPVDISAAGVGSVQQSKINEVSLTLVNDLGNDIEVGGNDIPCRRDDYRGSCVVV